VSQEDDLWKEAIYTQTFVVPSERSEEFELALNKYIKFMLNDLGIFFYKATWSILKTRKDMDIGDDIKVGKEAYFVDFSLYTCNHFAKEEFIDRGTCYPNARTRVESPEFMREHLVDFLNYPNDCKTRLIIQQQTMFRSRVYQEEFVPKGGYSGPISGLNWDNIKMFLAWWLIVPRVQYAFFDILYQLYSFDIAHQGWVPKFAHYFTIPGNVVFSLVFLCQFTFGEVTDTIFPTSIAMIVTAILIVLYLFTGFIHRSFTWGVGTSFAVFALYTIASMWHYIFKIDGNPWYASTESYANPLLWIYICSFCESCSHIIVPQLPPYITGVNHWETTLTFFFKFDRYVFASTIAAFTFSPLVSYISWPHLIGNMVLYQMLGVGYLAEHSDEYRRMVMKAELSGNPNLDYLPQNFAQLIHGLPETSGARIEPRPHQS